jgi:amino acid permease
MPPSPPQWVSRTIIDDFLVHHHLVPEKQSDFRFYTETVVFVVVTALVSIVLPELSDVIDIIGSTFATIQVFIFPALLFWKMYTPDHERFGGKASPVG